MQISSEDYARIHARIMGSLTRFPDLESFNNDELRRLVILWDDIFTRWLQELYRPIGIEAEHDLEDEDHPIKFKKIKPAMSHFLRNKSHVLMRHDGIEPPHSLGRYTLTEDQVRTLGTEGIVTAYLNKRLSQVSLRQ